MARETAVIGAPGRLSRAAAEGLYRVMAYKDEYEVARLHAAASYGEKPEFHMSPPLITRMDPSTGRRRKIAIPGSVALPLFRVLRHGKMVRGTVLDPFGYQAERRQERALIDQYTADLRSVLAALTRRQADHGGGAGRTPRPDQGLRSGQGRQSGEGADCPDAVAGRAVKARANGHGRRVAASGAGGRDGIDRTRSPHSRCKWYQAVTVAKHRGALMLRWPGGTMSDYDTDISIWSERQGELLRRRATGELVNEAELDWRNIAEEIEALGKSDRRELRNRIATLLDHLIRLQASPATSPRAGWRKTVREQRRGIQTLLKESPSLGPAVPVIIGEELSGAREEALASLADNNEQPRVDVASLDFTADQVLGPWLPE